jgi:hypothetical protein
MKHLVGASQPVDEVIQWVLGQHQALAARQKHIRACSKQIYNSTSAYKQPHIKKQIHSSTRLLLRASSTSEPSGSTFTASVT